MESVTPNYSRPLVYNTHVIHFMVLRQIPKQFGTRGFNIYKFYKVPQFSIWYLVKNKGYDDISRMWVRFLGT